MSQHFFLGLDIGGTKTAAHASRPGDPEPETWVAEGANLQRHGPDLTAERIAAAVREAQRRFADGTIRAVFAGVAGAGRPSDQETLETAVREILREEAPEVITIIPDAYLAIDAAFRGESGLLMIAGTGSIVLARDTSGKIHRAGGWGAQLGDEGSGYKLGLRALQAVADAFDGGPSTTLLDRMRAVWNIHGPEDLIRTIYQEQRSPATLAPIVVDAARTDRIAAGILDSEASALALRASWLLKRDVAVTPRLAFTGGLTQVPAYQRLLVSALEKTIPNLIVAVPAETPVEAALRRALEAADEG